MATTTALALPPLAVHLPDAAPSEHTEEDYWYFRELHEGGHDDYADRRDYPRVLALYIADGHPFSVQFCPGTKPDPAEGWDHRYL